MAIRAKRIEYDGGVTEDGALTAGEGPEPVVTGDGWSSENLVLAALCRCSLSSLRFSARRAGVAVRGSARAHGVVTLREEDGVYALVEADIWLDVTLDPPQGPEEVADLLRRAERGCFVGKSLRAVPTYHWTVNGVEAAAAQA